MFGPFIFIVVTTKNLPDIHKVEDIIAPTVTKNSVIVLIQNGIGIEGACIKRFPSSIVMSGVSMILSTNNRGKIDHVGQLKDWIFLESQY